jgi:hypothetical protein
MTRLDASDLAQRLGREAEAVCRHYLDAGHRRAITGRSAMRATRPAARCSSGSRTGEGPAGKWTDAATGEHGDLLDVIRESCGLIDFADVAEEARSFLSLPRPNPRRRRSDRRQPRRARPRRQAIVRHVAADQRHLVETYLRHRGITALHGTGNLRFHRAAIIGPTTGPTETWPAMIAAVTDLRARSPARIAPGSP